MNWLYPRTTWDLVFPSLLWYMGVWVVISVLFVGAVVWDFAVWAVKVVDRSTTN